MKKLLFLVVLSSYLGADWVSDIADKSKDLYNTTKAIGEKSLDLAAELITSDTEQAPSNEKIRKERFEKKWNDLKDKFRDGSESYEEKEKAPDSAWVSSDKGSIQESIDDVVNDIIEVLIDDDLLGYKNETKDYNQKIIGYEKEIASYKEEQVGAPEESMVHTTKKGYDDKIKNALEEISIYRNKIRIVQKNLKDSFNRIGVNLDIKQIDILLARADGDDIIQMSLIMNVLKQITNQILHLMKSSNENLTEAKRYYGMHLVSLSLVVRIQQKYIDKVNKTFLPKVDKIIDDAGKLIDKTSERIDDEADANRISIYRSNLKSQELTLTVARLYRQQLESSRNQMVMAQKEARKNLAVAENTYSTVLLSSGLYNLISESQLMFDKISKIQVPNIVPFENIQIEKKYRELTKKILSK